MYKTEYNLKHFVFIVSGWHLSVVYCDRDSLDRLQRFADTQTQSFEAEKNFLLNCQDLLLLFLMLIDRMKLLPNSLVIIHMDRIRC